MRYFQAFASASDANRPGCTTTVLFMICDRFAGDVGLGANMRDFVGNPPKMPPKMWRGGWLENWPWRR